MIKIISNNSKVKKDLEATINKFNLQSLLSKISGLTWKTKTLYIKDEDRGQGAGWIGTDTAAMKLDNGIIFCMASASHEFAHLLLKENRWSENPTISDFLDRHPKLDQAGPGKGYLLEQALVFCLQSETDRLVGNNQWDLDWKRILETNMCEEIGEKTFQEWKIRKNKKTNMIDWLTNIILEGKLD